MSILTDALPNYVIIDGIKYPIRTDFRVWLEFDNVISSQKIKAENKIEILIRLCFDKNKCRIAPPFSKETVSCLCDFYMCKKPHKKSRKNDSCERVFSFEYDADYIYAAFFAQYGIDLLSVPYMHWYQFSALFKGLDEDSRLMKIISWRSVDLSQISDKQKRKAYQKLKEIYALPDERSELQRQYDMASAIFDII